MSDQLVMNALRRLNSKAESIDEQMLDFNRRQTAGEKPDPNEFVALLKKYSITHDAMQAQFKLYEKPLKTVLTETK